MAVAVLTVVVMIPGLVFLVWGIVLVFKYRNRFKTAAAQARRTWAHPVLPEHEFVRVPS